MTSLGRISMEQLSLAPAQCRLRQPCGGTRGCHHPLPVTVTDGTHTLEVRGTRVPILSSAEHAAPARDCSVALQHPSSCMSWHTGIQWEHSWGPDTGSDL